MDIKHNIVDIIDVFNKNEKLVVPKYQRGYAWDEENFSEMWEDVKEIIITQNDVHFFGSIILAAQDSSDSVEVIDGQQRLTTFTVLFRVLYDLCPSENGIRRQIYKKIISKDEGKSYRLVLGQADEKFFEKYVKRQKTDRSKPGKPKSHKLIRRCVLFFEQAIKEYCEENEVTINDFVNDIFEKLETKTQLLQIEVPTDADAYTIFESINAKRVDLTPAELLKNYIFSIADNASRSRLVEVEGFWSNITDNLSQFNKQPELTEYVRHYWISSHGDVQQKKLYKVIRKELRRDSEKVASLARGLSNESFDYAAIYNSGSSESTRGIKLDASLNLSRLNYKQAHVAFLALLTNNVSQAEYDRVAIEITNLVIRRSVIGSNPNELEKIFGLAARSIRKNYKGGVDGLLVDINKLMPSDKQVILAITEGSECPNSRFILEEMEQSMSSLGGKKIDKPTLEHIMPQTPQNIKDWDATQEQHQYWVNNIGNLTLLERPINSSVKNRGYQLKVKAYEDQRTDMNITKELIKKNSEWNIKKIQKRAEEIAEFVVGKW